LQVFIAGRWPARRQTVRGRWIEFGQIEIEGERYSHDIVIDRGRVAKRTKKPSRRYRDQFGHTPLSVKERIPWGAKQLIIGTGESGSMPIMPAVWAEAEKRGIEIVAAPTQEALRLLGTIEARDVHAVLHVTC
jgi:hypothetical protein